MVLENAMSKLTPLEVELLEALEFLVTRIENLDYESDFDENDHYLEDAMNPARQAIAKARGE